jgi:hypothetical protein
MVSPEAICSRAFSAMTRFSAMWLPTRLLTFLSGALATLSAPP